MKPPPQGPSIGCRLSGDASAALSSPRWRRLLRSDFTWVVGTVALTSLSLILLMGLWRADLQVPFRYRTDALYYQMVVKGALDHGWIFQNPDLGAPWGQELRDFPDLVGSGFHFLIIKLLGLFFSDPALVFNLYFLLCFPLVALASFLVLRQLGISTTTALVCSVLYALAPYHFVRGEEHYLLSAYYSVPVGAYLALSILAGKPLFRRRTTAGPWVLGWASKRSLVTLVLCLLVASTSTVYYAVFTGMLLIAAMALILVTRRDVRMLVQGTILLIAIFGFLALEALPYLMYEFENGPNYSAGVRDARESEYLALRLTQMVLPLPGHHIGALSNLAERYYIHIIGDIPGQSLGFIATLGFAWLLLVWLAGCLSPHWKISDRRHRLLATAAVIAFLIGTSGGISSLFAYLINPQIRGWNRISIFIAFFAIAAVGLLLDALVERIHPQRQGRQVLAGALLLSVLVVGLYDHQPYRNYHLYDPFVSSFPATFQADYSATKDEYRNDALFVEAIDRELPPQAEVFQLPYVPFPEHPPDHEMVEMVDYEHLRPYLHESDLRWSYGAVKGRPTADWQADLADKPTEALVSEVSARGFDGIYIDRFGYPDRAARLEGELGELLETEPLISPNGRMSFFSLLSYKERTPDRNLPR